MAVKEGKIFVVTSVKGGVGKTTTVLNLAAAFDQKILVVDFDLYGSAIAASLNAEIKNDLFDLFFDVENKRFNNINDYIVSYNQNIDIIASPNDPRKAAKINIDLLELVFYHLKVKYDYILVDTNHVKDKTNIMLLDLADQILFVVTPNLVDLKNIKTMINIYENIEKENYKIIINRSILKNNNYDDQEIRAIIKRNIDYVLTTDLYQKNYEKTLLDGQIGYYHLNPKKEYQQIAKALKEVPK